MRVMKVPLKMLWRVQGAQQAMFPGGQDGAAHAAAQMPLSMAPEGEAMFNTNSISSKSPDQAGFPPLSKKVLHASPRWAQQICS